MGLVLLTVVFRGPPTKALCDFPGHEAGKAKAAPLTASPSGP